MVNITNYVIFRKHKILTQRRGKSGVRRGLAMDCRRHGGKTSRRRRGYLGLWNRLAGPLLGGDGFDDKLAAIFRMIRRNDFLLSPLSMDDGAC
jgi:hypothetical protein